LKEQIQITERINMLQSMTLCGVHMSWRYEQWTAVGSMLEGFFLNNQPDTLIIPVLFCYKTLHVSGIFSAHYHEFSTVHSALVSFMQVSDDRFQAESGWNCSSILTVKYSWWWAEKMPETCRVL